MSSAYTKASNDTESTKKEINLSDLRKVIPSHCFCPSYVKSLSYLLRDIIGVVFLIAISTHYHGLYMVSFKAFSAPDCGYLVMNVAMVRSFQISGSTTFSAGAFTQCYLHHIFLGKQHIADTICTQIIWKETITTFHIDKMRMPPN
ncbi:hypothetical protein N7462_005588 [Penicillium macrosclerotiorum]|uniref:uncharacterized protein n=1 Tax=Penicillium macrosclerotiorum TaxID=303699 RepID=UPI00254720AB|nr:uncharacterized protein N7462_005588 [Penicillium macrosclerotiorum]KAJ5682423.1 hypothetical protein N7462_005588 [Penicillium macrosclerotiorum]